MRRFTCIVSVIVFLFLNIPQSFSQGHKESGGSAALPQNKIEEDFNKASLEVKERQEKTNRIVSDYTLKKVSREEAEKKLAPLVKEELKDYLSNLDYQIQILEKRLQFLKKGKENPSYLVEERIKEILDEVSPQEMNYW